MSTLYFIRHGQASFGQANYDKLSEMGELQSRLLGEYWIKWGVKIGAVYSGSLDRQIESAKAVAAVFAANGKAFPQIAVMKEFDEYDTRHILTGSVSTVLAQNPDIAKLVREIAPNGAADLVNDRKAFQRVFSRVMDLWVDDKLNLPGMEKWKDFTARVNASISRVISEQSSGKTVAVFTSGGPISAAMQRGLGCADKTALELGWVIANGSITEFRYSKDKFSLFAFNSIPHLGEPRLITYR